MQRFGEVQLDKVIQARDLTVDPIEVAIRIAGLPRAAPSDALTIRGEAPAPVVGTRALAGGVEIDKAITDQAPQRFPNIGVSARRFLADG